MLSYKKLLLFSLIILSSCGFKPLYYHQKNDHINKHLAKIYINPIEDRIGQLVRNHLKDRINPYGVPDKPLYRLSVTINDSTTTQSVRLDDTATRENFVFKASYQLEEDNIVIVKGESRAEAGYNILTMPYGTTVSKEDATRRAAVILAEDIALRLSVYFKNINQNTNP